MKSAFIGIMATLSAMFVACSHNETSTYDDFATVPSDSLQFKEMNESFDFGYARKMIQYDSLLIVLDDMQKERIQFFNKNTGEHIASFGQLGQGKNELVAPGNISIDYMGGILSIYDYARAHLLSFNMEEFFNMKFVPKVCFF